MNILTATITEFTAPRFRATLAAVASAAALFVAIHASNDLLRGFAATLVTGPELATLANDVIRFGGLMICVLAAAWVYRLVRQHQSHAAQHDNATQWHGTAPAHALLVTDDSGRIVWTNHAFSELTGYSFEEALGRHYNSLLKVGRHDQEFYKSLLRTLSAGLSWHGEIINRRKDGVLFHDELTITPLSGAGKGNADAHQSDRNAPRQIAMQPAYYDPLNRLPKRDLMLEHLKLALDSCAHRGSHAALMLIDMTHSGPLAARQAQGTDDSFMTEAAKRIDAFMHSGDMATRYGEHEVAVILELGDDEDEAYLKAMRIAGGIQAGMVADCDASADKTDAAGMSAQACITCCIGIAVSDQSATSPEQLLKRAAAAMHQARAAGYGGIRFYRRTAHASMPAH